MTASFAKSSTLALMALATALAVQPRPGIASADPAPGFHAPTRTFAGAFLAANAARERFDFGEAARYYDEALRFDPGNPGLRRDLMISLVTDGQIGAAVPHAEILKDEADVERIARLVLGVEAIRENRYLDAEPTLILAVENDLERLLTGILRAWARHGAGDTDGALDLIDGLRGPDWFDLFSSYHGALIADAAGRADQARTRYADGMNNAAGGSASPLTYLRLAEANARFLARTGELAEAREVIGRGLGTAPNNPDLLAASGTIDTPAGSRNVIDTPQLGAGEILLNLGSAINRDGAEDFAALYLELARSMAPENAQILFELGGIAEKLGQPERAIRYYASVPADSPLARIADLQRGLALSALDRHDEAKATLAALIEDNPDDFRGYLALGGVYASLKEFEEAADVYEAAVTRLDLDDSRFWQMHYRLGIAYERTDRWPEAERTFKHTLTLSPDQPDVLNYLGYSWVDMNMHLDEGIEMIRTAVEQRPRDGYIVDSLGWAYYRLGEFENAVEHLERATDLRPRDSIINDHLGDAYWRVGRKLEATYQWSRALAMEGEDDALAEIRAKLDAANAGEEPAIAESRVDSGAAEQASDTAGGNDG
ncbi:tetratricopeptide repeat protein [Oceaniradius stylonematis]|nr:tetratricopeptide repeat protein [Oceaniradius stylonematis]